MKYSCVYKLYFTITDTTRIQWRARGMSRGRVDWFFIFFAVDSGGFEDFRLDCGTGWLEGLVVIVLEVFVVIDN